MTVNEFINTIAPLIKKEAKAKGYSVCSTVIAQAIIESFGKKGLTILASKYHNYFGMKCGEGYKGSSVNLKTNEEYSVGVLTRISDNFRTYPDMLEGVKGYYRFISAKRYANLKTAKTYTEYAQMLKADGYATSSKYIESLCDKVVMYNLTRFDSEPVNIDLTKIAHDVINGLYGTGEYRKVALKNAGYDPVAVQAEVNRILKA